MQLSEEEKKFIVLRRNFEGEADVSISISIWRLLEDSSFSVQLCVLQEQTPGLEQTKPAEFEHSFGVRLPQEAGQYYYDYYDCDIIRHDQPQTFAERAELQTLDISNEPSHMRGLSLPLLWSLLKTWSDVKLNL